MEADLIQLISQEKERESIFDQTKKYKIDFLAPLPEIEPAIEILDHATGESRLIATLGNFSLLKGKAKSRKSFLLNMLVASTLSEYAFSDTFYSPLANSNKKILFIDTEQADWHIQSASNRICKLANDLNPDRLSVYKFRSLTPSERLEYTEKLIQNTSNLGLVVIDGIRDMVTSINDEAESSKIASLLLKWSEQYNVHIITVLHENPSNDKARGHLGTELSNKAETVLQIEIDSKQPTISIIKPFSCRNKAFEPFAFNIEDNMPNVLVGFDAKSSNTKEAFDLNKIDDSQIKKILDSLFKDNEELKRSELKILLSKQLKLEFPSVKTGLGQVKVDALIVRLQEEGVIGQETARKPYKLYKSNS